MDGNVTGGTDLDVKATTSGDKATATSKAVSGGLFTAQENNSNATSSPTLEAHIGAGAIVSVTGNIDIEATGHPEADASTKGVAIGGITVSGSESNVVVSPDALAYIGANAQISSGGLTIKATVAADGRAAGLPDRLDQPVRRLHHGGEPRARDR